MTLVYVKCTKCGEIVQVRLRNTAIYFNHCHRFQPISLCKLFEVSEKRKGKPTVKVPETPKPSLDTNGYQPPPVKDIVQTLNISIYGLKILEPEPIRPISLEELFSKPKKRDTGVVEYVSGTPPEAPTK